MKIVNLRDRLVAFVAKRCAPAKALNRFRRDENGAMLVFGLILFVLMIMIGGMAVDLMRHERLRTEVQQTLDRSVLNAAGLSQKLDAELVVRDSFAKMGLTDYLKTVNVETGLNFRRVSAYAVGETNTFVMHMMGIKTLAAEAGSVAEQQVNNIEVVLVLDVSGSMTESAGATTKIVALKAAATKFIDDVLDGDGGNRVSITIVPFNAQVNLGLKLRQQYTGVRQHGIVNINCVELPDSAFNDLNISRTATYEMFSWADPNKSTTSSSNTYLAPTDVNNAKNNLSSNWTDPVQDCNRTQVANSNIIQLPSSDPVLLKARINGLAPGGRTSTTLGMKWGMSLLDPGARPMFESLVAGGDITEADYAVRPFEYTDEEALKFVILMTDGIHVAHNTVNTPYKTSPTLLEMSPIWKSTGDGKYSIQHAVADLPPLAAGKRFWVPHLVANPASEADMATGWSATVYDSGAGALQQTWQQVWTDMRVSYVAWQFYARALGRANGATTASADRAAKYVLWYGRENPYVAGKLKRRYKTEAEMDASLLKTCSLVKAINYGSSVKHQVTIFGIAFQAPTAAQTLISNCSTPGNYFDAQNDVDIKKAFAIIASQINYLRLTQ